MSSISKLKDISKNDTFALLLFVLFNVKKIPEFSTLSELITILDYDQFLKLCKYFGGLTIKIPTMDELEILVNSLVLYEAVNINGCDFDASLKDLNCTQDNKKIIKKYYKNICEVLNEYSFK